MSVVNQITTASMKKDHRIVIKVIEAKNFQKDEELDCFVTLRKLDISNQVQTPIEDNKSFMSNRSDVSGMSSQPNSNTMGRRSSATMGNTVKSVISAAATNGGSEKDLAGKTKTVWKSKTPWFDEEFEIELDEYFSDILVELYARTLLGNKLVGSIILNKYSLESDNRWHEDWYSLRDKDSTLEDIDEKRIAKSHEFQPFHVNAPKHCDKCRKMMWAKLDDVAKCSLCGVLVHNGCSGKIGNTCGTTGLIRLKYIYTEEYILPLNAYSNLMMLITNDNFHAVKVLGRVTEEREETAKTLVTIFEKSNSAISFLKSILSSEIQVADADTIFRANSLGTKALDQYMKLIGGKYLKTVLSPVIHEIILQNRVCEVDPTRMDMNDKDFVEEAYVVLEAYIKWTLDVIYRSAKDCPYQLKQVFAHLRSEAQKKFPNNSVVGNTVITAFIFLRFFSAATLGPQLFGLTPNGEPPNARNARTFTLMSKTIQQLANMVPFDGNKEPHMVKLNHLITGENMVNLKKFLTDISTEPSQSEIDKQKKKKEGSKALHKISSFFSSSNKSATSVDDSKDDKMNLDCEMAAMHRHFLRYIDKMCADPKLTESERTDVYKLLEILNSMMEQYLKRLGDVKREQDQELRMLKGSNDLAITTSSIEKSSLMNQAFDQGAHLATTMHRANKILGVKNDRIKELAISEGYEEAQC
ncbi:hypothetical protein MP228_009803 [Amoeboaphelidium protococcarum]|nr:hypothetical protein MP228_009803 [Amoeboaphelidium protococcarum]